MNYSVSELTLSRDLPILAQFSFDFKLVGKNILVIMRFRELLINKVALDWIFV